MSEPHSRPIHLTLLRHGDLIAVDLAETGALIPRSETHVEDAFLRDLASEMEAIASRRTGGTEVALARLGGLVFSHLLTEPARRRLRDASGQDLYLRLDERLVHVPWELCHDGAGFLVERLRIGRQVITGHAIPEPPPARRSRERLRVLLVADPTENLPQAAAEGERLCSLLDEVPGIEVTLLSGRSARRIPLLAALGEHEVVHFAGHSHYDPAAPQKSGWHLSEGVLTAAELAKLRPPPLLVFSNSCAAATSPAWEAGAAYEGRAFGIGSAFLLAGVPAYVGTFWVVHDAESTDFATACYRALAAGDRLGDALDEARRVVIATHGRDRLTWASYLLYGDPAQRPLPIAASAARPTTAAAPAAIDAARPSEPRAPMRFAVSLAGSAERSGPAVARVAESGRFVGRHDDLARLEAALDAARAGERGAVLVSGPPGIGKTSLVDAFLGRARAAGDVWVAEGQSIEHYGAGEPYLPLLDALGRLARSAPGHGLVETMRRVAPTWLAQLPGLLEPAEIEALRSGAQASTRERMLREMAELLEALTAERPLLLVLEDLHWSDHSTLESIAYVAQRREPARLLVVGTYRPAEIVAGEHPLRAIVQELVSRRRGLELALEPLAESQVAEYLRGRLAAGEVDDRVARLIHQRTEGHPLFLVNVVDFALREGILATADGRWSVRGGRSALGARVPAGLRPMIERQIEALAPEDRAVLEAAAVAGAEFSIAAVAAALEARPDDLDDRCEGLAWRGQFLRAAGVEEWPDGTLSGRYRFVHALYQNVLYERVAEARRARLHRRIGERKEAAFGARASEIAGELAAHFAVARDLQRAVEYQRRAGEVAVRRRADREAIEHFQRALDLLSRLPETQARAQAELGILVALATPLMSTAGYAANEVEQVFERAHALSRQVPSSDHLPVLLRGLTSFYQVRARNAAARTVGEELLALCAQRDDAIAKVQAHYGHGVSLYNLIEIDAAERHFERALELYDETTHPIHVSVYGGYDPGVACRIWLGWLRWLRGMPDRALEIALEGRALAARLGHAFTESFACSSTAVVHLNRGESAAALALLAVGKAITREHGFAYHIGVYDGLEGWAALLQGRPADAIASLETSLASHAATGASAAQPGFRGLLGMARAFTGSVADGLAEARAALAEAERTEQALHLCQLHRTCGTLLARLDEAHAAEAEAHHRRDLELALGYGAPMFEIEATLGLARFLAAQGRSEEARALLAPLPARHPDASAAPAMREGSAILEALEARHSPPAGRA